MPQTLNQSVLGIDDLLIGIVNSLQLTKTQYDDAEGHYKHVGEWLDDDASPLRVLMPEIFPQGSMLLQTTVRPIGQDEFDLDLVVHCDINPYDEPASELYRAVQHRVEAHADLAKRLKCAQRCLRLQYQSQFHLDVVPACPEPGGNKLYIPDRRLWEAQGHAIQSWRLTDPLGFAEWFRTRAQLGMTRDGQLMAASVQPLPSKQRAAEKLPLQIIVQLFKRARDIAFQSATDMPSSILLTTLSAKQYAGQSSVAEGFAYVIGNVRAQIQNAGKRRIQVINPTIAEEDFATVMSDATYVRFVALVELLYQLLTELPSIKGFNRLAEILGPVFGQQQVERAVHSLHNPIDEARRGGNLIVIGPTVALTNQAPTPSESRPFVRENTFYGH